MIKKFLNNSFVSAVVVRALLLGISSVPEIIKDKEALPTIRLTVSDFERVALKRHERIHFVCTDSDPQLHYIADGVVTGMKFYMESTIPTGEIMVYYTTAEGRDFSELLHAWATPVKGEENRYEFSIPARYVYTLRIDPSISAGNMLTFGDFILNPPKTFGDYFPLNYKTVSVFALYTAILWALSRFILEIFTFFRKKHYKK